MITKVSAMCLAWAALAGHAALAEQPPQPRVLIDFDQDGWLKPLRASGKITVKPVELPAPVPEASGVLPAQRAAQVRASAGAALYTRPEVLKVDWARQGELSLWAYRQPADGAQAAPPAVCEVRLLEPDGRAWFWRKVEIPASGWTHLRLPLAWLRIGGGRVPQWGRVERLAISFRGDAEIWLDTLAVSAGSPLRSIDDLRGIAFPHAKAGEVKVTQAEHVTLLTSVARLQSERLAEHLAKVEAAMRRELPFLETVSPPPCLIVFPTRAEYEAFTPRLAARLASEAPPPKSGGFTVEGIATSYWEREQGTLRPVFTHEYVHALLHHAARLPNTGEWVQEGLATRYQLQFHPQANFSEIVRGGLAQPRLRDPLETLTNGKAIAQTRYWQAATLHELLLSDASLSPHYAGLLAGMQAAGSTELGPLLKPILKTDWSALERKWKEHCAKQYSP